jgi:hypothetical protein
MHLKMFIDSPRFGKNFISYKVMKDAQIIKAGKCTNYNHIDKVKQEISASYGGALVVVLSR